MALRDKLRFGPLAPEDDEFDLFHDTPDDELPPQEGDDRAVAEGGVADAEDAEVGAGAADYREHAPAR
jgi:hypothetical protein